MIRRILLLLSILLFAAPAQAQGYQSLIDHPVRVCDAQPGSDVPPDFRQPNCRSVLFYRADPQDRMLWAEFLFEADDAFEESSQPLGLFISAKASSEAILNGVPIGANGLPGASPLSEVAGDMDSVFFIPEGTLRSGTNRLVMRMSSMNGGITLHSPIHNIVLAPYRDPRQPGPATWFALITFGLFAATFVFFGVRSFQGNDRQGSILIAGLSLFAALQLAAEAARDIMPYPYPLHDLRLSLILSFAIGVGICFAAYVLLVLFRPHPKWRALILAALMAVMLCISVFVAGFDLKTGYVLVAASVTAAAAGGTAFWQGNPKGIGFALAGSAIAACIIWLGGFFLDTVLYIIIAAGLLWLLFKQARAATSKEPPSAKTQKPARIELTSNGKVEFVEAQDVVRFSGAGDYVEVFLNSGRSALYNASLAALERDLSGGFIRVHRSHIVNAACVQTMTRESAGTGELQMTDGSTVPVSRRNMAGVREALSDAM